MTSQIKYGSKSCPLRIQIFSISNSYDILSGALGPFTGLWRFEGSGPIDTRIVKVKGYLM